MAQRFDAAEERLFNNVFICMRCNARNRMQTADEKNCRKCGYDKLRKKHKTVRTAAGAGAGVEGEGLEG